MNERLAPRVLYLTLDPERVARQLAGEQLARVEPNELASDVSTDEMIPAWACYFYDQRLGHYCMTGFRGDRIEPGALAKAGFSTLVGGAGFGCGSSRETAPYAQRAAGIRLLVAESFERTYRQNCHNLGLYTTTDLGVAERVARGEPIGFDELTRDLDESSRRLLRAGGLARQVQDVDGARAAGASRPSRARRPLTLGEKILAAHAVGELNASGDAWPAIAPGDELCVRADVRFSHDYVTAMIDAQMREAFGEDARVRDPDGVFLFRDHLTLLDSVMPAAQRRLGLLDRAEELHRVQRAFAERHGVRLFDQDELGQSQGICHNLVVEQLATPGALVVGTDSHTCTAGVLGCFAFGVGSTAMAAGFVGNAFGLLVPESVRIEIRGRLSAACSAKDAWLALLARDEVRGGVLRGRVIELGGEGYLGLPLDERATLTNMAAEAGAFTAIGPADDVVFDFLQRERGLAPAGARDAALRADDGARYAAELVLDLDRIEPMLALPGDPKAGIPLRELGREIGIDIAYGGSCTGGKRTDMDLYASVLRAGLERGRRVAPGVELFLQFGSQSIRRYAEERGHLATFEAAGAKLLAPACGACIGAGPGVSRDAEQVTISAINRNFPGRSGPGRVYLASPLVVAASALLGRIGSPLEIATELDA